MSAHVFGRLWLVSSLRHLYRHAVAAPLLNPVTVGSYHTCAILSSGTVKCWGTNNHGSTGMDQPHGEVTGTTPETVPSELPALVIPDDGYSSTPVAVHTNSEHTCIVFDDGTGRCFGLGGRGRLGDGSREDRFAPGPILELLDGEGGRNSIVMMSVGRHSTCALLEDKTIRCWGMGNQGRLGNGGHADVRDSAEATPVPLPEDEIPTYVAIGGAFGCALVESGKVFCWGSNYAGQLGDGEGGFPAAESTPVQVQLGGLAKSIAAGDIHACAVLQEDTNGDEGRLRCWGTTSRDVLGHAGKVKSLATPDELGDVPVGEPVDRVFAGDYATCVSLIGSPEHRVKCWGGGVGWTDSAAGAPLLDIDDMQPVAMVAMGENGGGGVTTDGALHMWGSSASRGYLGLGDEDGISFSRPEQVDLGDTILEAEEPCSEDGPGKSGCAPGKQDEEPCSEDWPGKSGCAPGRNPESRSEDRPGRSGDRPGHLRKHDASQVTEDESQGEVAKGEGMKTASVAIAGVATATVVGAVLVAVVWRRRRYQDGQAGGAGATADSNSYRAALA